MTNSRLKALTSDIQEINFTVFVLNRILTVVLSCIFIVAVAFCEDVKYLGCYVDSGDRDLDGFLGPSSSSMTINTCIATCKAKGDYLSF